MTATGAEAIRRAALSFAACVAIALAAQWLVPPGALTPVLLAGILLGGMPHGGLDVFVAKRRFPLDTTGKIAAFFAAYLGLAGAVVAAWFIAPTAALLVFLGYSAVHFGGDFESDRPAVAFAAGLAVLGLPALASPGTVAALFDALGADGAIARDALRVAGAAALALAVAGLRDSPTRLAALAALAGLAWAAHPLGYFFAYFCGAHGPMHVARIRRRYAPESEGLSRRWIGPAVAAGLAVIGAALLAAPRLSVDEAGMRAVFIGFAALTVPHMALVDFAARRMPKPLPAYRQEWSVRG